MDTNLPVTFEGLSAHEIRVLTGQASEGPSGIGLPSLRVNYQDVDDNENALPRGMWSVSTPETGQIFAKEVDFRIYFATLQYAHFDADAGKHISSSIHFRSFKDDAPDSAGGNKCGKVSMKQLEELDEGEKKIQKAIKLSKVLFGTVTMTGKDVRNKEHTIENLPCVFYARGTHFMPMANYLEDLQKNNVVMFDVYTKMALKTIKDKTITYWEVVPSVGDSCTFGKDDMDLIHKFAETAKAESESILVEHDKARKALEKAQSKGKPRDVLAEVLGDDDLDDEIPF